MTEESKLPENDGTSVAEAIEDAIEENGHEDEAAGGGNPVAEELKKDKDKAKEKKPPAEEPRKASASGGAKSKKQAALEKLAADILPTEPTPRKTRIQDLLILVFGEPKVGKSTFAAQFPGAVFLPTEPGLNHLSVNQIPRDGSGITSWQQFLNALAVLSGVEHPYQTMVVDTVDNLYKLCAEYVCKARGISHLSDLPNNAGYSFCNQEFERVLRKMMMLPFGVVLVSHSQEKENRRTGAVRVEPTMTGSCQKIVCGLSDMILYLSSREVPDPDNEGKTVIQRVVHTKPSPSYKAGDRTDTLPPVFPLHKQPKGFALFRKLFDEGLERIQSAEAN